MKPFAATGIAILLFVGILASPQPLAQSTTPTFEVATVKPNKDGSGLISVGFEPGGRFRAVNTPLRLLVRLAYEVQDFQILGGPGWLSTDRFDIVAKADGVPPLPQIRLMLRALLEDRFRLAVHTETREQPIYALVIARSDGRTRPELRPSGTECAPLTLWPGAPPPPPPPAGPAAAPRGSFRCPSMFVPGRTSARDVTMAQWATTLSQFVSRFVTDRTGLTGSFDFDLQWTPDQMPPGPPGPPPIDLNGPSLFTALQEQLGLKLDPQRGPAEVLVVDRVEQPSEN
ncbi:MAG: TIGR03435 family protein [Vicinamibacterales bacterium]